MKFLILFMNSKCVHKCELNLNKNKNSLVKIKLVLDSYHTRIYYNLPAQELESFLRTINGVFNYNFKSISFSKCYYKTV